MDGLGFTLNFEANPPTIAPTQKRISSTCTAIREVINHPESTVTCRALCVIGGKIGSCRLVVGNRATLHTRYIYYVTVKWQLMFGVKDLDVRSFPHAPSNSE